MERQATLAHEQNIRDIRKACPAIEWVELSEVEYAKDHEGDCVYIKGRIRNVNFEEDLLDVYIGRYSATIAAGLDRLTSRPGRLVDDAWINIYGYVDTESWASVNQISDKRTPTVGIMAILIEGPNKLVWIQE